MFYSWTTEGYWQERLASTLWSPGQDGVYTGFFSTADSWDAPYAQFTFGSVAEPNSGTKYGLDDDLELVQTDIFSHLGKRKFDLIISNPPYVTHQAMEELPAEYRHEPALALEAGDDGMDFMRRFMPALKEHLTENGVAIVEIGDGREAFEAIWPELPVTWLSTEEEEDMVFAVRAEDLQHL